MRRLLVALFLVLSAIAPAAMAAGKKAPPPCWWTGYEVSFRGKPMVSVGPYCVPCLRFCDLPFPSAASRQNG